MDDPSKNTCTQIGMEAAALKLFHMLAKSSCWILKLRFSRFVIHRLVATAASPQHSDTNSDFSAALAATSDEPVANHRSSSFSKHSRISGPTTWKLAMARRCSFSCFHHSEPSVKLSVGVGPVSGIATPK